MENDARGPTFEECAKVIASHLFENRADHARIFAAEHQRVHGYCEYKLLERARELRPPCVDLSHAYGVVAEMLEYFDSYRLASWAPLAAIIERERASAIEARSDATGTGAAEGESAAAESRDAQISSAELYFSKGGVK